MSKIQAILIRSLLISFYYFECPFGSESNKGWISVWQKLFYELFNAPRSSVRNSNCLLPIYIRPRTIAWIFSAMLRSGILATHGKNWTLFAEH